MDKARRYAFDFPRHSKQVAAWIYEIVNPIMDGLEYELDILKGGQIGLEYPNIFRYVSPINRFIYHTQRQNLRQLFRRFSDLMDKCNLHDEAIRDIQDRAIEIVDYLVSDDKFVKEVEDSLYIYWEKGMEANRSRFPGGSMQEKDFPVLVAVRLVNNDGELDSNYTDHDFWRQYQGVFLSKFGGIEEIKVLADLIKNGISVIQKLIGILDEFRFKIADACDLPLAPPHSHHFTSNADSHP